MISSASIKARTSFPKVVGGRGRVGVEDCIDPGRAAIHYAAAAEYDAAALLIGWKVGSVKMPLGTVERPPSFRFPVNVFK